MSPRLKGSKNKAGRPPGAKNLPSMFTNALPKLLPEEILEIKQSIIALMTNGTCLTVAAACRKLGIDPQKVSSWAYTDPDFKKAKDAALEIMADDLEDDLRKWKNPIPRMMLLKRVRKEYRDNYQGGQTSGALEKLLVELTKLAAGANKRAELPAPKPIKVIDTPFTLLETAKDNETQQEVCVK